MVSTQMSMFYTIHSLWSLHKCLCPMQVYKGWLKGHTPVAVKYIDGKPTGDEKYVREVRLLKDLNHVNILRFLGAAIVVIPLPI